MKEYIKLGLFEGTKMMGFFIAVSLVWALVLYVAQQMQVSPGWAMLGFFTIAIYYFSIATQKLKYESELARQKIKEEK